MRICRLTWDFPTGRQLTYGLGPTFYHISKEQAKLGLDVHVVAKKKSRNLRTEQIEGINIHFVDSPYNLNALRKIFELHKRSRLDIIHAHSTCGILYPIFRREMGVPLVVHVHGTTLGMREHRFELPAQVSLKQFARSKIRDEVSALRQILFWRRADLVVAVSQAQKIELKSLYGIEDERIRVVYLGVDVVHFSHVKDTSYLRKKHKLEDKRVVLFVGHFGLRKGIPFLIKAMPQILKEHSDARLLCVGGTPRWLGTQLYWDYLKRMIQKVGVDDSVKLIGEVPHYELPYYYSMSDVFAFPSLYEAFGKVITEAMACETPVVASGVGGIPEIIQNNSDGLLVEPGNVDELATAISEILGNSKLAKDLGRNARKTVENRFTWRHTAKNLSRIYDDLLKNR